jgi:hypothetical protein
MVSASLASATEMELAAIKTRKERKRIFWLPRSLGMCMRGFVWASCLTQMTLSDLFGLEELLQTDGLVLS